MSEHEPASVAGVVTQRFRGATVRLVLGDYADEAVVSVKSIADGIGLYWGKVRDGLERSRALAPHVTHCLTTPDPDPDEDLCLPIAQVARWLAGIRVWDCPSPEVFEEVREHLDGLPGLLLHVAAREQAAAAERRFAALSDGLEEEHKRRALKLNADDVRVRILRAVKRAGSRGLGLRELTRYAQGITGEERRAIVDELIAKGLLAGERVETGRRGRPLFLLRVPDGVRVPRRKAA